MSHLLSLEADELLNEAIMSSTPIIIVEGDDDVSIYDKITESLDKSYEVYASENIIELSDGKSGCSGVIKCLEEIEEHSDGIEFENFILGIIDRDASIYRGDDMDIKGLFILNYYSIESHLVNINSVRHILLNMTNTSTKQINENNIDSIIFSNLLTKLSQLYYISLDALKNACESEYNEDYKYSDKLGKIINDSYEDKMSLKKTDLDEFATMHNLSNDFNSLLLIVKGKWLLTYFIKMLQHELNNIKYLCKNAEISQCQFCATNKSDKCIFKLLFAYDEKTVKVLIMNEYSNFTDINYIKERIDSLNC